MLRRRRSLASTTRCNIMNYELKQCQIRALFYIHFMSPANLLIYLRRNGSVGNSHQSYVRNKSQTHGLLVCALPSCRCYRYRVNSFKTSSLIRHTAAHRDAPRMQPGEFRDYLCCVCHPVICLKRPHLLAH